MISLLKRILARDRTWFTLRLQILLGLRRLIPKPIVMRPRLHALSASRPALAAVTKQPKILVFSHNLQREGAPISLQEMIRGLAQRVGLEVSVISFEEGPLRLEYTTQNIPVTVFPTELHELTSKVRLDAEVRRLVDLIQLVQPDVIVANTLLCFTAVLAAEQAGIPSIWIPRESEPWNRYFQFLPDPVAQCAIAAIGLPSRVIFVAHATRDVWHEFEGDGRFAVIHNALNLARFRPYLDTDVRTLRRTLGWAEEETVFICPGTVCERKGQLDAIEALSHRSSFSPASVRLVFLGAASGPYARALKRKAIRRAYGNLVRIDFVEATAEIGRYYRAADVFLMCSRVESYPRVTLEAMAFGLPVITTRVFGVKEQLPQDDDACFYSPGDTQTLAAHLLLLATNPESRAHFSLKSTQAFSRLPSFEEMCDRYYEIFTAAASSTPA